MTERSLACSRAPRPTVILLTRCLPGRKARGGAFVSAREHGADDRIRTGDLLITNQLLYQLSYVGLDPAAGREGPEAGRGEAAR